MRSPSRLRPVIIAAGLAAIAIFASACGGVSAKQSAADSRATAGKGAGVTSSPPAARTRAPAVPVSVMTDTVPETLTAKFAQSLFVTSPVVVVAVAQSSAAEQLAAEQAAAKAHAPLILANAAAITPQLARDVQALHPKAVLAEGLSANALQAKLHGVSVFTKATRLPATGAPLPLSRVAVLTGKTSDPAIAAITATAQAAGAAVVPVTGADPRTDPAAITTLARVRPQAVIGIGAEFNPAARLASRLAVAETGQQLPGGGQVMFPGRRLVALYGHPGASSLGALGQQSLPASVERAKQMAGQYDKLSNVPVIPTFEIIATVAEGSAGADGQYSAETPLSELRPWIDRATSHGMYVVLDLQPGRANLLEQAKKYQSLLERPNVGLALDPEWKLQPGQVPLQQIGHVDIKEVNSVVHWLAALTAQHNLPQKLLVIHQFRPSMITGEKGLDTSNDDLSILLHMDGQGSQGDKQSTWNGVTAGAPRGVWFGWKNFFVKDTRMLSPQQTMSKTPTPVMISYQ